MNAVRSLPAPIRFVGRQPIVDENGRLFGYELLSRDEPTGAPLLDPEAATRGVFDYWSMLPNNRNEGFAFVNCTRASLIDGTVTLLPRSHTILEILENIEPDAEVMEACGALRRQGYRFALDDFSPIPSRAPLIELADFIKIDFLASDAKARREIYAMAGGAPVQCLAEKVETQEVQAIAASEGCSLFQGYFFSRPVTMASRALPQSHFVYLRLFAALQRRPADLREIERLLMSDASLTYRVLRLANSAVHGRGCEVTTVRGALLMVGDDAVRRMISVAAVGALAGKSLTPLLSMALVRARFCEQFALRIGAASDEFYLLGLLSLLDVLLDTPIERILEALPIGTDMKSALTGKSSHKPCPLELVRGLENCDWTQCEAAVRAAGLSEESVAGLYLEAVRWAANSL
ncbi:MAG TPA: HDOD domain-containing protein [Acidobacteriaceae bacterium]|nr:HDOD domain-containing protein [Acidobacteriaceae bacterium]